MLLHGAEPAAAQDPLRGDKLLLAQVFTSGRSNLSTQQLQAAKRVLDTFSDAAAGEGLGSRATGAGGREGAGEKLGREGLGRIQSVVRGGGAR